MNVVLCITFYAFLLQSSTIQGKVIKKRQIYREQVLPHAGGRIPDTAFQTDRLLLNRLQKEGIAIPDGVILEQRNPQVHPYTDRATRPVYRVEATRDGRYTPVEGTYIYRIPPGIETTYLYPQIHNVPLRYPPARPIVPQIRPLIIPSPYATDNLKSLALANRNNKNTVYLLTVGPKNSFGTMSSNSPNSIVNYSNNAGRSYLPPDVIAPSLFSHFDNLFNNGYTLRVTRATNGVKSSIDSNKSSMFSQSLRIGPKPNPPNTVNPSLSSVPMMPPVKKGS